MHIIKRSYSVLITLTLIFWSVAGSHKILAAGAGLRDVPQSHWAHNSVKTLVQDYGFMQGDPNGNFAGSRAISRYEFAKTMNNMLEYFKKQMEADHKDLEGLVSVMEMFQTEIKSLESKMSNIDSEFNKQNTTVSELNEIVVALGEEYNALKGASGAASTGLSGAAEPVPQSFEVRLAQVEEKVSSLQDRGLLVGTLLRGTLNDIRNVSLGTGKLFRGAGSSVKDKLTTDADEHATNITTEATVTSPDVKVTEEVRADVSTTAPPATTNTVVPPVDSVQSDSESDFYGDDDEDLDEDIDSYYD